ncbi:MAG: Na+/H+ antiporter [Chitinophagaceae bacterium]
MEENLLLILTLLFISSMLTMLSTKLRISYPIFLVIGGLLISFIPGIPVVALHPDLVFIIFLPPLLYSAAWNTSWKDFLKYKRPIVMLATGLVIFTSAGVAFTAHAMIPDFTLALGFLLGGIVSPPDAVAAASVLQNLHMPKRVLAVLEGESLINDASSLIVFRVALGAVMTGQFFFWESAGGFVLIASMGILIGLVIANIIYAAHRFLPTTASIDTTLTIISPYIMYISAEHFHFSGVMAVVTGGLFLSYRSQEIFTYNSRIQVFAFWQTLTFLLNSLVFILIGLQLPAIIAGLGSYSVGDAILYGLVISILIIGVRLLWIFPGAYLPRILSAKVRLREVRPSWQTVFVVGWSGMRGVVSLASALAVPLTLSDGTHFPHRNLILFITFIVILVTLVLQGLSLPFVIRILNVKDDEAENAEEQELTVRLRLATVALEHMQSAHADDLGDVDAFRRLKERYERMIEITNKKLLKEETTLATASFLPRYRRMLIEIVMVRRKEIQALRAERIYGEELLRTKEWELDLEEARLMES